MKLLSMTLSAALLLGGLVLLAPEASAGPRHSTVVVTRTVPTRRVVTRTVVQPVVTGHYEWRVERVWIDGEVIGHDRFGRPIVTEGYWTTRRFKVWVEDRIVRPRIRRGHVHHVRHVRPVRRPIHVRPRPVVTPYVSVGVGFGF